VAAKDVHTRARCQTRHGPGGLGGGEVVWTARYCVPLCQPVFGSEREPSEFGMVDEGGQGLR
jgi:hypothetical protein